MTTNANADQCTSAIATEPAKGLREPLEDFAALQARASKRGLVLHQLRCKDGTTVFLIVRNPMWREFPELSAVADFLARWEGKR